MLLGPGHCSDMLRMQSFLTRNGYPFRLLDTDEDPDADGYLSCFKLTPDQLPVVIGPGRHVLHNPTTPELADDRVRRGVDGVQRRRGFSIRL